MWGSKRDTDVKNTLLDAVGQGEGGMIWENSTETCILSYVKQIASPGSMHETGCSGLVHWDDPEGWVERTENCSAVFLTVILRFTQQNFNTGYNRASTINLEAFAVCGATRNTCETKPTGRSSGQPTGKLLRRGLSEAISTSRTSSCSANFVVKT